MATSAADLAPGMEFGWDVMSKVHRQHHGINSKGGVATSILFETHHDAPYPDRWLVAGRVLDYVGHGSEPANQTWDKYNLPLRKALEQRRKVHVFEKTASSPSRYRYHGHWLVLEANEVWTPEGRKLLRFILSELDSWRGETPIAAEAPPDAYESPGREEVTIIRVIRDTLLAMGTKRDRQFTCQVCGHKQLRGDGEPYAEAHHIKPLKHDGPDVLENLLVLCARHHVDFDYGAIAVDPEDCRTIRHRHDTEMDGRKLAHPLSASARPFLRHHWERIWGDAVGR